MGIVIQTGGALGQLGGGVGKGFAKGVDTSLKQQREDQLRQEEQAKKQAESDAIVAAIGESVQQDFANQDALTPDTVTERVPQLVGPDMSLQPAFDRQLANPADLKIKAEVERFDKLLGMASSPEAAAILAQSAKKSIIGSAATQAVKAMKASIGQAQAKGILSEEEALQIGQRIATATDPEQVLQIQQLYQKDLEEKTAEQDVIRRKGEALLQLQQMPELAQARVAEAMARGSGVDASFWTMRGQQLREQSAQSAARFELDPIGFDMAKAQAKMDAIINQPNPYQARMLKAQLADQKQKYEQENIRLKAELDAARYDKKNISSQIENLQGLIAKGKENRADTSFLEGELKTLQESVTAEKKDAGGVKDPKTDPKQKKAISNYTASVRNNSMTIAAKIRNGGYQSREAALTAIKDLVAKTLKDTGVGSMEELKSTFPEMAQNIMAADRELANSTPPNIEQPFNLPIIEG